MKVFVTPNQDAPHNLIVSFPAYGDVTRLPEESDDEFLNKSILKFREGSKIPDNVESHIVEDTELPADHECSTLCEFFDAWEWGDSGARVNMNRARELHRTRIRQARDIALYNLDVPWMKAQESGDLDEQNRIKTEKERLRDLRSTFDLAVFTTPESLKQAWPDGLPKE